MRDIKNNNLPFSAFSSFRRVFLRRKNYNRFKRKKYAKNNPETVHFGVVPIYRIMHRSSGPANRIRWVRKEVIYTPRAKKAFKEEWAFFLDEHGHRSYNQLCQSCVHKCKQSFRTTVYCPKYLSRRRCKKDGTGKREEDPVHQGE